MDPDFRQKQVFGYIPITSIPAPAPILLSTKKYRKSFTGLRGRTWVANRLLLYVAATKMKDT
jgi:hypothetical protein